MAAPVESFVQIVTDASNVGDKHRSQSLVVGANTVHQHDVITVSSADLTGVYEFVLSALSVQATAHNGTTSAFFWMILAAGSTVAARLRRLDVVYSMTAKLDMLSVPRIVLQRVSFTGICTGASLTVTGRRSLATDQNAVSVIYTASTGLTVNQAAPYAGIAWSTFVPSLGATGGVGASWNNGPVHVFAPRTDDAHITILPGEGLAFYQVDNGTASDSRRLSVSGIWDEYEL